MRNRDAESIIQPERRNFLPCIENYAVVVAVVILWSMRWQEFGLTKKKSFAVYYSHDELKFFRHVHDKYQHGAVQKCIFFCHSSKLFHKYSEKNCSKHDIYARNNGAHHSLSLHF